MIPLHATRLVRYASFLLILLLGAACIAPTQIPSTSPPDAARLVTVKIHQLLEAGDTVKEIAAVERELPSGLHKEQLSGYFQLGSLDFVLAMQPSLNVPLSLPEGQ